MPTRAPRLQNPDSALCALLGWPQLTSSESGTWERVLSRSMGLWEGPREAEDRRGAGWKSLHCLQETVGGDAHSQGSKEGGRRAVLSGNAVITWTEGWEKLEQPLRTTGGKEDLGPGFPSCRPKGWP